MTPTDPLFAQQWHFGLMGRIQRIWDEYRGAGVSVVLYDNGAEYTHPDLAANFDASAKFSYGGTVYDPMPIDSTAAHGTACAGLIGAAADNGVGGVGVAPEVTLAAVNYLDVLQYEPASVYDAAVLYAANFDVMSNSWGYGDTFKADENLSYSTTLAGQDHALWTSIAATGRGGLGTVIVKAAGNEASNVNGDGWNVSRFSITVAATGQNGFATSYSNYGSAVLVAAPAASVTTDLTGAAGYNAPGDADPVPADYTSTFGGTSAATPLVSGVIALMLDANPNLGWRDVQDILALTAHHTGSNLGAAGSGSEVGGWMVLGGSLWNGGGAEFHQSYGYGMVDAFAAVRYAQAWSAIYGQNVRTSANERTLRLDYSGAPVAIPDSDGKSGTGQVALSVGTTAGLKVEAVEIRLTLAHSFGSDLRLWLKTPDGTMIPIFDRDGDSSTFVGGVTWTFEVDALRGYRAAGTWSVVAEDMSAGDTGQLQDLALVFHGAPGSANDVCNFTSDFQRMAAYQPERKLISDTNGGIDTLNFASIVSKLTVNMGAGGAIRFGGAEVARLDASGPQFERLYAGDGADSLTGNRLNNVIWGARGGDTLSGMDGADRLWGGRAGDRILGNAGADTLHGGNGNDTVIGGFGNDLLFGGWGQDTFVFARGAGSDRISGWQDNIDTLSLDDAIWGGGLTIAQVLSTYGHVEGADTVLDFGTVQIRLAGYANLAGLQDDIVLT